MEGRYNLFCAAATKGMSYEKGFPDFSVARFFPSSPNWLHVPCVRFRLGGSAKKMLVLVVSLRECFDFLQIFHDTPVPINTKGRGW